MRNQQKRLALMMPAFCNPPKILAVFLAVAAAAEAQQAPVVSVAEEPAQKMMYGMDFERLWSWDTLKPAEKKRLAKAAVSDCRVQYVRVAIRGAAEPKDGTFEPEAYSQILDMMAHLKAVRPDIAFFGSPRPINAENWGDRHDLPYTCFPMWITEFTQVQKGKKTKWNNAAFHPEKAADYMIRYLRFMKSKGFTITYLDLKNEVDRLVKPQQARLMAERIREQLGSETPLLVTPSSFDYSGAKAWLESSEQDKVGTAYFDIASTHNTGEKGSLAEVVAQARKSGKAVWNTELHSWRGPDDEAATNTAALLYQIREGVSGINDWLSLGNEKKAFKMFRAMDDGSLELMRTYYIYKQLVNTSGEGRYVPTTVPDSLCSTAAFLRGKLLTVWLLNAGGTPVKDVKVDLGERAVAGTQLQTTWWGPDNPREGSTGTLPVSAQARTFTCGVAARTLICFAFEIR